MIVDKNGYRLNVGIIIINSSNKLFWAKKVGFDSWQFPQGGVDKYETLTEALFRELYEEVGITEKDVEIIYRTRKWNTYKLPKKYLRYNIEPLVIGQKQKWFFLRYLSNDKLFSFTKGKRAEFESWKWVDYWDPIKEVVFFKKRVYCKVLAEFERFMKNKSS